MFNWIKKFFHHKEVQREAQPLRIDGVADAPLTAEADDAELAAQALLESLAGKNGKGDRAREVAEAEKMMATAQPQPAEKVTAEYYRQLADRMRQAHDAATMRTMRFVAFCEQELRKAHLPYEGKGSLQQMEVELYKRIDTIEREGGELKRRWQHCLAEVTIRMMDAPKTEEATAGKDKAAAQPLPTEKEKRGEAGKGEAAAQPLPTEKEKRTANGEGIAAAQPLPTEKKVKQ